MDTFDNLPISAVVNGQYLCMHGGISSHVLSVEAINQVDRKMEPPGDDCLLSDLLWADPARNCNKNYDYEYNDVRMVSCYFGQ